MLVLLSFPFLLIDLWTAEIHNPARFEQAYAIPLVDSEEEGPYAVEALEVDGDDEVVVAGACDAIGKVAEKGIQEDHVVDMMAVDMVVLVVVAAQVVDSFPFEEGNLAYSEEEDLAS